MTRFMTPEAARRIAKARPGSGFARRSARAGHNNSNNSQRDTQSQPAQDKEMQAQNRESGATNGGHERTQADQASINGGQEQVVGEDQCPYCTSDNFCARHASEWGW